MNSVRFSLTGGALLLSSVGIRWKATKVAHKKDTKSELSSAPIPYDRDEPPNGVCMSHKLNLRFHEERG